MEVKGGMMLLSKPELRALLEFTYQGGPMNGKETVLIDLGKGTAVAVDGHTLVQVKGYTDGKSEGRRNVRQEPLRAAMKRLDRKSDLAVVCLGTEQATFRAGGAEEEASYPEEKFPSYEEILKETPMHAPLPPKLGVFTSTKKQREKNEAERAKMCKACPAIGFNPLYLARLSLVAKACWVKGTPKCHMTVSPDDISPVRFDFYKTDTLTEWTVLIMPMRLP